MNIILNNTLDTNIEFKIVIFENGNFKDWEKLPNNGNRYHFIKFSKVCLEMKEFVAEVRERPVAKYDSDSELKIPGLLNFFNSINLKKNPYRKCDLEEERNC